MKSWSRALEDGALTGGIAAAASLAALAWLGRRENASAAAPINAVSHIAWGRPALRSDRVDARHTLTGALLHAGSGLFWGVLFEKLLGTRRPTSWADSLGRAAAATAAIAVIDLGLVPDRVTPGFERRLSNGALAVVFAALAGGLAVGSRITARR